MLRTRDLVIGLVALAAFFFGAKRLPEIASPLGNSMQEFRKGVAGDTGEEISSKSLSPEPAESAATPRMSTSS